MRSHSHCAGALAAGVKALPDGTRAFAQTQALWRFLANPKVSPKALSEPLLQAARESLAQVQGEWVLCVHDWSRLNYLSHQSKSDRLRMTHAADVGYELQSSLLVSAEEGMPLSVPAQNLATAQGVWQSRQEPMQERPERHLDELTRRIHWLEQQGLGKRLVHVIDREADSVGHLREWSRQGRHWLVRVKGNSTVRHGDGSIRIELLAEQLSFVQTRTVQCKGEVATQWIGAAPVLLIRKARPKRAGSDGLRLAPVAGAPLAARLVVSRLYGSGGRLLAQWYLLSSLPETVEDGRIALWYYFRWQIESFFKLLKQGGHQLERWAQESGVAIFKRLLIATHACVLVWQLARQRGEGAERLKHFLVRLSGRQTKRAKPITMPALLDGLSRFLVMLETLEHYSLADLKNLAELLPHRPRTPAKSLV